MKAKAVILVFDITNSESLKNLQFWFDELALHLDYDIPKIVIANKIDLINNKKYDENLLE